jgi:predicted small secreted protein
MSWTWFIRILAVLGILASGIPLTACNTVEGFGEDVSALGRGVSRGAERSKQY